MMDFNTYSNVLVFFGETSGALPLLSECLRTRALRGAGGKAGVLGRAPPSLRHIARLLHRTKGTASWGKCIHGPGMEGRDHSTCRGDGGGHNRKGCGGKPRPALALARWDSVSLSHCLVQAGCCSLSIQGLPKPQGSSYTWEER